MSIDAPDHTSLDDLAAEPEPSSLRRLRFSLLTLLIVITLVGLVLAWLVQPNHAVATALFEVRNEQVSIVGKDTVRPLSKEEFETLKKTQVALLKSKFLLSSALVNPGIASLPVLSSSKDKEAWLQEHLEIEFPQDGEILSISLHGTEPQAADLAALVDAVAAAYKKEVLGQERQRKLTIRDMVAKSLEILNNEYKRKAEDYLDIAKALNKSAGSGGDPLNQINTKRLDRIDGELLRLEGEQLKNETAGEKQDAAFLAKRLEQLRKQKDELEKTIRLGSDRSVELESRQQDLTVLRQIVTEMATNLEKQDIDLETPPRIRQVQQAVITLGN
jgi:hypothetical protein